MSQKITRIHERLEAFIRKYYRDQLIRGGIYFATLLALAFIALVTVVYFGSFSIPVRTGIFWFFVLIAAGILLKFVVPPVRGLFRLGNTMKAEEAARILGVHFPEVSDRLLNLLQLEQLNQHDSDLILASIEQKAKEIEPVPFESAIELKANWKTAAVLIVPLFIAMLYFLSGNGRVLSDGSKKMIAHRTEFIPTAPYTISLANENLQAIQNEDFRIEAVVKGSELPERMYISFKGRQRRMEKTGPNTFVYSLSQVRESIPFKITTDQTSTPEYLLDIIPRPFLQSYSISLDFPQYTGLDDKRIENQGDLFVPEGTVIQWTMETRDTEFMELALNQGNLPIATNKKGVFSAELKAQSSGNYTIIAGNQHKHLTDTAVYRLNVKPDAYPSIGMEEYIDSANPSLRYFTIQGKDDYGFSKAEFVLKIGDSTFRTPFDLPKGQTGFSLYHYLDESTITLKPGQTAEYYAKVWDNDGVNGAKSAETRAYMLRKPTQKELKESIKEDGEKLEDKLEENLKLAKEIEADLEKLNQDLLNKKELSWEDQKRLEELIRKQKELQKNSAELKEIQKQRNQKQENLQSESILEKQKKLEELMEKVLDEETLRKMEELQKMMDQLNKEELQDALRDLEKNQEDLSEELDRNLELFKRFEVEKGVEEAIEELNELQEAQEELQKETEAGETKEEDLKAKQDSLNKAFDELKENYDELQEKNQELEQPMPLEDFNKEEENIEKSMQDASQNLQEQKKQKASESQKKAAEEMKKMAESMMQMNQQAMMEQNMENMEDLRQLLDNLVEVSLDQEALLNEVSEMNPNNPKYVDLIREQNKILDDAQIVKDSLNALATRVVQIEKIIKKELDFMLDGMETSVGYMAERQSRPASSKQQESMTAANNLALLLSDVLKQMQEQMAQEMPGNQQCQKPGGGKPNPSTMNQLQQQINEQMKQMQKMMEEGKKPGQKPGQGKKPGTGGMSQELAKMAARQEALRKQLQEMLNEQGEDGTGNAKNLQDAIDKMEETEEDLLNKIISPETLKRQEEILTRLLEAENAERERKQDEERKSKEAEELQRETPPSFLQYQKEKAKQSELFKTVPADLHPFYKSKTSDYFNTLEND